MQADILLTAGPFFGVNAEPEFQRLTKEAEQLGARFWRCHRHKAYLVVEGWKTQPTGWEGLPSAAFIDAVIAKEISGVQQIGATK